MTYSKVYYDKIIIFEYFQSQNVFLMQTFLVYGISMDNRISSGFRMVFL